MTTVQHLVQHLATSICGTPFFFFFFFFWTVGFCWCAGDRSADPVCLSIRLQTIGFRRFRYQPSANRARSSRSWGHWPIFHCEPTATDPVLAQCSSHGLPNVLLHLHGQTRGRLATPRERHFTMQTDNELKQSANRRIEQEEECGSSTTHTHSADPSQCGVVVGRFDCYSGRPCEMRLFRRILARGVEKCERRN